ncbi:MAG: DUF4143 domain-containing protein [Blastocatellia bacterium]
MGQLWEHYVLNELTAQLQTAGLRYWRDKQGHEVDLIWAPRGKSPTAIECKWSARDFNPGWTLSIPALALAVIGFGYFKGMYDANIRASLHDVVKPERRATACWNALFTPLFRQPSAKENVIGLAGPLKKVNIDDQIALEGVAQ